MVSLAMIPLNRPCAFILATPFSVAGYDVLVTLTIDSMSFVSKFKANTDVASGVTVQF